MDEPDRLDKRGIVQFIAVDPATGERVEITDLYWFEENGIQVLDEDFPISGICGPAYQIEIHINGQRVFPPT